MSLLLGSIFSLVTKSSRFCGNFSIRTKFLICRLNYVCICIRRCIVTSSINLLTISSTFRFIFIFINHPNIHNCVKYSIMNTQTYIIEHIKINKPGISGGVSFLTYFPTPTTPSFDLSLLFLDSMAMPLSQLICFEITFYSFPTNIFTLLLPE